MSQDPGITACVFKCNETSPHILLSFLTTSEAQVTPCSDCDYILGLARSLSHPTMKGRQPKDPKDMNCLQFQLERMGSVSRAEGD